MKVFTCENDTLITCHLVTALMSAQLKTHTTLLATTVADLDIRIIIW